MPIQEAISLAVTRHDGGDPGYCRCGLFFGTDGSAWKQHVNTELLAEIQDLDNQYYPPRSTAL